MKDTMYTPIRLFFGYIFAMLKSLFTRDNRLNEEETNGHNEAISIANDPHSKNIHTIALSEEQHKEEKNMSTTDAVKAPIHSEDLQKLVNAAVDTAAQNIYRIYCEYHNRALKMHQIPETIEYRYRGLYAIDIISKPFGKHDTECFFSDKEMERLVPDSDSPVYHEYAKMFRAALTQRLIDRQNFVQLPKQDKRPTVWVKIEHPFVEYVEVISKSAANTLYGNICDLIQQYYMDAVTNAAHVSERFEVQYFPNGNLIRISTDTFSEFVDYWYQIKDIVPEGFIYKKAFASMMRTYTGKKLLAGDLKVPKNIVNTELFTCKVHEKLLKQLLKAGFAAQTSDGMVKYLCTMTPRANIGLMCTPKGENEVEANPEEQVEQTASA